MKAVSTYRYKLHPNAAQIEKFEQYCGVCRNVYNMALEIKSDAYKYHGKIISRKELQKQLPALRAEYSFIEDVNAQTLQASIDRLFMAYDSFFANRAPYPKFRNKIHHNSFVFKQGVKCDINNVYLPKIGNIRYRNSRDIPSSAKIKRAIVKKEKQGWFISIVFEYEYMPIVNSSKKEAVVGIDLGVKNFAVLSTGDVIKFPSFKDEEKLLKIRCRSISRKVYGSNNRKKEINKAAILHAKIRHKRNDFLHKMSTKIVNESQVIVLEDLNIRGMSARCRNVKDIKGKYLPNNQSTKSKLNKSILNSGWGMFGRMIEYKIRRNAGSLIFANRFYASSKQCSQCHSINVDLKLSDRVWLCKQCGTLHDRDANAAKNLKAVGHTVIACGVQVNSENILAPTLTICSECVREAQESLILGESQVNKNEVCLF